MEARPLRVHDVPLQGMNMVEASAGTGKTHAITGLYLRLVIEQGMPVDRILVVTFTRAATAELRDRIRRRLSVALEAFRRDEAGDDALLQVLLPRMRAGRESVLRRLENALLAFDLACVFTIHGFCQRALADHAFESGAPFEAQLLTDESGLLREVVTDFWRREVSSGPAAFADCIVRNGMRLEVTPDDLQSRVGPLLGRPWLRPRGDPRQEVDLAALEAARQEAFLQARELWWSHGEHVRALLMETTALNRNMYRTGSVGRWLEELADLFTLDSPPPELPEKFDKFTPKGLATGTRGGQDTPAHPFFDACGMLAEAALDLKGACGQRTCRLHGDLLEFARQELPCRKLSLGLQSYNDLLVSLRDALRVPGGQVLASTLSQRYRAALIDEFQDTDPVQYEIFERIYGGHEVPVFLVGDPKQAIYSFRGADVHAYLKAREGASTIYTLTKNWRSTPPVIDVVNALFDRPQLPFIEPRIGFLPSGPAGQEQERLLIDGAEVPAFVFWYLSSGEEKRLTKERAGPLAAEATAAEIVRILDAARGGDARLGDRPVQGADIAVLVRTHDEGLQVREALGRRRVSSVELSQQSVFASAEAEALERLMLAVVEPAQEGRVRGALATDLLGVDATELVQLEADDARWEAQLVDFRRWHVLWRDRGFIHMLNTVLRERGVMPRLLAMPRGERRVTNLRHLAELVHAEARLRHGPEALIKWFSASRADPGAGGDANLLRLESDDNLVRIVTIHSAKGLQYPIVFCPFAWGGKGPSRRGSPVCTWHDPDSGEAVLEICPEDPAAATEAVFLEDLAEQLRLLYVALTRARYRCYVGWGRVNGAEYSALGWLLHPLERSQGGMVEALKVRFAGLDDAALIGRLEALREDVGGGIVAVQTLADVAPAGRLAAPAAGALDLTARQARRILRDTARVSSYSALMSGHGAESPDYDELAGQAAAVASPGQAGDGGPETIARFPRGARPGICLHQLFERLDFTAGDPRAVGELIRETLGSHGFEPGWRTALEDMVGRVLRAPLDGKDVRLSVVGMDRRLNELEFHYPVADLNAGRLRRLLEGFGPGAMGTPGPVHWAGLDFAPVQGFLKGYIDLVFEAQGRYWVLDYKSNWLGEDARDYAPEQMAAVMDRESYHLQYLLYTLAVHRLLGSRLADYDYERHFGGVFYVFLRGVDPERGATGIFRARPGAALVEAVDRFLAQGAVDA